MFHGKSPFYDMTEYLIFQKIKKATFQIDKVIPLHPKAIYSTYRMYQRKPKI